MGGTQVNDWTVQNCWYRHRCNSVGSDSKLGKLVRTFGARGYAVFFLALEYVYSGCLGELEIESMASTLQMSVEEIVEILKFAVTQCNNLLTEENGRWDSSKAETLKERDQQKREDKAEKSRLYRERLKNQTTCQNVSERGGTEQNALISFEKEEVRNKKEDVRSKIKRGREYIREFSPEKISPSPQKITALMDDLGKSFDVSRFIDYYTVRAWTVDGIPIISEEQLKALVSRWPEDKGADRVTRATVDESQLVGVVRETL